MESPGGKNQSTNCAYTLAMSERKHVMIVIACLTPEYEKSDRTISLIVRSSISFLLTVAPRDELIILVPMISILLIAFASQFLTSVGMHVLRSSC